VAVTLSVHVEDKPGSLDRVASLIRRRAFNIMSLAVGPSERPDVSRMTIVVDTDADGARRIEANLYKVLTVLQVQNITDAPSIFRDMALVKVVATPMTRPSIVQLVEVFRGRVVDVAPDSLVIEITGTEDKVDGLVDVLRPYGVLEMVRTGRIAISRGARSASRAGVSRALPEEPSIESAAGISCSV
jgi:acetolactate synthase-1/3 small subunit